ncbi:hypothetical protein [Chamaesiphon polymorphus]|nr:hypothetical protein [Chamaesiphon polymorphus]
MVSYTRIKVSQSTSHPKSGWYHPIALALTPNPSPKLGRGEPEPQDLAG